jgi:hypothetical protein
MSLPEMFNGRSQRRKIWFRRQLGFVRAKKCAAKSGAF